MENVFNSIASVEVSTSIKNKEVSKIALEKGVFINDNNELVYEDTNKHINIAVDLSQKPVLPFLYIGRVSQSVSEDWLYDRLNKEPLKCYRKGLDFEQSFTYDGISYKVSQKDKKLSITCDTKIYVTIRQ